MTTYTIDRSSWRNAKHGVGTVALLNPQDFRCCLGMIAQQCAVPDEDLLNVGSPDSVPLSKRSDAFGELLLDGFGENNALANEAMDINDDETFTDAEREENLALLFSAHGVTLEFVGRFAWVPLSRPGTIPSWSGSFRQPQHWGVFLHDASVSRMPERIGPWIQ